MAGFKIVFIDIGKNGEISMNHLLEEVSDELFQFLFTSSAQLFYQTSCLLSQNFYIMQRVH